MLACTYYHFYANMHVFNNLKIKNIENKINPLKVFYLGIFYLYFKLVYTDDCVSTIGKNCQNPNIEVLVKTSAPL